MRSSFKTAYSSFDRIGYFINYYFDVGLKGTHINFKNVWKDKLIDGNGETYFVIPNPIMERKKNLLVHAMFWLQKDLYEDKKINVQTNPKAEPMFRLRNDMEHNYIKSTINLPSDVDSKEFTKYATIFRIDDDTFRLLKLLREMIVYLALAVKVEMKIIQAESKGQNS